MVLPIMVAVNDERCDNKPFMTEELSRLNEGRIKNVLIVDEKVKENALWNRMLNLNCGGY